MQVYSSFIVPVSLLITATAVGKKCSCSCDDDPSNRTTENAQGHKTGGDLKNNMEGFIVGGNTTTISHFPHSVAVFVYPREKYFCGGSVLNQKMILTAAHCAPRKLFRKNKIYIMAGHENLLEMLLGRLVGKHVCHVEYDPISVENDICLLFLSEELQLGPSIQRVVITPQYPLDLQTADVAGWGTINDTTRQTSLILKYTSQTVIPLEKCMAEYETDWSPGMMCAGNSNLNRPSKGDSGSALIAYGYLQIGLVSYRNLDSMGVIFYTNVSYFSNWIATQAMVYACGNYGYSQPGVDNKSATDTSAANTSTY